MAQALIFLFASLLIFLILTEVITVNIFLGDQTVIDINLTIFALRLTKKHTSEVQKTESKKKRKKKKPSLSDIPFMANLFFSLVKRCEISINDMEIEAPAAEPAAGAFRHGLYFSLASSALAFAGRYAKKFDSSNIIFRYSAHNDIKITLDASIKVRLLDFIICLGSLSLVR